MAASSRSLRDCGARVRGDGGDPVQVVGALDRFVEGVDDPLGVLGDGQGPVGVGDGPVGEGVPGGDGADGQDVDGRAGAVAFGGKGWPVGVVVEEVGEGTEGGGEPGEGVGVGGGGGGDVGAGVEGLQP